ncbi:hypothetical protein KKF55_06440 [Patescibacteria group bacterium]|nr:hypothetical protein [Patescibacteria group bacterium]
MIAPIEDSKGSRNPKGETLKDCYWHDLIIECIADGQTFNQHSFGLAKESIPTQEEIRKLVADILLMYDATELTRPDAILYLDWLTYDQHVRVIKLLEGDNHHNVKLADLEEAAGKKGIPCTLK